MQYAFDTGNRLRNVAGEEGGYAYDAWGRRVAQTDTAGTIYSFYDRGGRLIYQRDRMGGTHDYLYLGGKLVAIRDYDTQGIARAMRYQHTDALGSVIRQTDKTGQEIANTGVVYDAWGGMHGVIPQDGPGYTGHVQDANTHLVYMQQRYYDPGVGRFLSMDPVDASGTDGANLDRYWYAKDNPYRYTDPTGMCTGTHICTADGLAASTGTFTTMPLAGDALRARIATAASRVNQAANYLHRHEKDVSGSYSSPGNAASAFGKTFANESAKLGVEFGANIFSELGSNRFTYSLGDFGVTTGSDIFGTVPYAGLGAVKIAGSPGDVSYWGMVHTHWAKMGNAGNRFSWNDWKIMIERRVNGYVIFPDQTEQSFDYSKYNPQTMTPGNTYYEQDKFSF